MWRAECRQAGRQAKCCMLGWLWIRVQGYLVIKMTVRPIARLERLGGVHVVGGDVVAERGGDAAPSILLRRHSRIQAGHGLAMNSSDHFA